MNSIKEKIKKLILGLTSAGIILMILPASLYSNHFRYGTMSWEPISDNGTHITIRLEMKNGWTANHGHFRIAVDYDTFVSGYVGSIKDDYIRIYWDDGENDRVDIKIISRDNSTPSESSADCSSNCVDSTVSEMGVYNSGTWTTGIEHTYPDNGTNEYVVYWTGGDRAGVENSNGSPWRNETKINIGGSYDGNSSPVSSVPPVVQVQDNTQFNYQLSASDVDSDSLNYRWGTKAEFFNGSGVFTEPTGMTLSSSGLVSWDVRDTVLCSGCTQNDANDEGDLWVAVVMLEDKHDNGSVKSYIPIDFFFKTASASNYPPTMLGIPTTTQTVSIGNTKTFTFTATDDSGDAPTFSVLTPPSDNSSIWSTSTSTSGGTTTFSISFTPVSSMDNVTYHVPIRSTDGVGMTKDQTLQIKISSVSNADPTAPTLVSPANGATVTKPVSFQWTKSTDSDNDVVSYSLFICTDSGFAGCSGTTVSSSGNLMPPFNQYLRDTLISWPRKLVAAPIYQHISQDLSTIPKWLTMLTAFVLLSGLISFLLKNISHRKPILILIFLIIFFSLNINSCARSDSTVSETASSNNDDSDASSSSASSTVTTNDMTYSTSDLTASDTTYYWKVVASDTKGGSAESTTWSFTVQ